jgi:Uma2 family endonuclease
MLTHMPMPRIELGRSATYDDLVALPDHVVGEIVDDELWAAPRPAPRHAWAAGQLMVQLGAPMGGGASGRGGWRILPEPELHFSRQVVVPDLAGWRLERLPRLPAAPYFELAPDWVCEILSPSTQQFDRDKKLSVYAAAGVGHVWLVDPLARSLEVLRRTESAWARVAHHEGRDVVQAAPFTDVDLSLLRLWDDDWM